MRIGIFIVAGLACIMGITISSVYGLWFLCSDLVYVVLFPQLFSVIYIKDTNTYGSMCAYWIGIILRLLGGEPLFNIPAITKYPFYDEIIKIQRFPYRTTCMLISFAINIIVSYLTKFLFQNYLSKKWDIFKCYSHDPIETIALQDSVTFDEFSKINLSNPNIKNYAVNENEHSSLNSNE
jgi:high affinity choline transporter 7